jgi:spore coat protein B
MESPNLDSYHSFLQSLIGEEVQVYRGGPESKQGKLLDVQSDYITVYAQNNNNNNNKNENNNQNSNQNSNQNNNQNTVVYYRTQHLQSISENTKNNSYPRYQNQDEEEIPFKTGADFNELVWNLKGTYVQINLGGPESKNGMLLDVSDNYVALLTEDDGVVYYNIQHMKSISEYNQNNSQDEEQEEEEEQEVSIPEYIVTNDFHDIFAEMSHKWVSINRGGPEALEGILVHSAGGHYTLINNDEVLRINPYHIKSISCGPKGVLKNNNNDNSEENSDAENSVESSSSNYQNGGDCLISSSSRRSSSSSSSRRSSSSSSSRRSSSSSSSRRRRRRRSSSSSTKYWRNNRNETVVNTRDYIWLPKG